MYVDEKEVHTREEGLNRKPRHYMQGTCLRYVETDDPNMSAYTEREKRLHGTQSEGVHTAQKT